MENKNYYGVYENQATEYQKNYIIELTEKRYSKTDSGKSWKKNADSEKTEIIEFNNYINYLSSIPFFKNLGGTERVEKGYTIAGYIPTQLTSISPMKDTKVIRHFSITRK